MTYRGQVKDGIIVLEGDARLPEGTVVSVEPIPAPAPAGGDALFDMPDLAVETGIRDLASNIDHYLYGHPKAIHDK